MEHAMVLDRTNVRELRCHAAKGSKSKVRLRIIRALVSRHMSLSQTKRVMILTAVAQNTITIITRI